MPSAELEHDIAPETLEQLRALDLIPGRPLIAVDVDEVLVVFVDHLSRYIRTLGFEMRLVRYQLEGSMFPIGSDDPIPFEDCIALINKFFAAEAEAQEAVPGGAAALARLSQAAQIVILTNVPRHATEARRRNLDALGLRYPMVVNSGGKGRAMAWLAAAAGAPCAFVDDSVKQVESVAKHAPDVYRIHFAWAGFIDRIFPACEFASARARSWDETATLLETHLSA